MNLLESLAKVHKIKPPRIGKGVAGGRELVGGGPLPPGMVPNPIQTMEFRDANQNGIEDREEGMYRVNDLVPRSSLEDLRDVDPGFNLDPSQVMPNDKDPLDELDEDDRRKLDDLLGRMNQKRQSPFSDLADQLAAMGEDEDTQLAHVRPGEVVLPPEFFDDPKFEKVVERKFKEFDINPEVAIVSGGIASLNPNTGLEQFGFFKKIGKSIKKFAKKIAPVAGPLANFIPGVGPVLAGVIGAGTNLAAGKGIKGAITGGLSGYGAGKVLGGIGGMGTVGGQAVGKGGFQNLGFLDKFRALGSGAKAGIGSLFGGGQQMQQPGFDVASGNLDPNTGMFVDQFGNSVDPATYQQYISNPSSIPGMGGGQQQGQGFFRGRILDDLLGFDPGGPGSGKGIYGVFPGMGQGQGGGGGFLGGGGGFGDALKIGGLGALAAGLGKLAYEDAKKQKGVPLTPLTTMSPTGRYNIEAEIARRMGQQEPNPVEFGLLPQGTIPELSGGKPRNKRYGGSVYSNGVEDLQGGFARGMMYGGPVMAYAEGGAVQMQEGGELDLNEFPRRDGPINGEGTETSDDIPAMLSDGEFVMTGQAVRGAGSFKLDNKDGILSLIPSMEEDRERGMSMMYELMDLFANKAQASS